MPTRGILLEKLTPSKFLPVKFLHVGTFTVKILPGETFSGHLVMAA